MNDKIQKFFFFITLISMSFVISNLYSFKIEEKKNSNIFKVEYFKFNILMGSIILLYFLTNKNFN